MKLFFLFYSGKRVFRCLTTAIALLFMFLQNAAAASDIAVTRLTCNHFTDPAGILSSPVFSWQLLSGKAGQSQQAYEIIVSTSEKNIKNSKGDMWDSEKIISPEQSNILYNGTALKSSSVYYWKVRVWDANGKASNWSEPANFITGLVNKSELKASWISNDTTANMPLPLFAKTFTIDGKAKNAIIHIAGLGYYELYVNGKKVGDHVLDPGQTNYDDYAFYVTYRIDTLLKKGLNTIGVMLGDGWYNQDKVWGGNFVYGKLLFWCQLDYTVKDKKLQFLSDASWKWTYGPIQSSNVYAGEVYDARKALTGWSKSNFDRHAWKKVSLPAKHPTVLKPQDIQPIKKMGEIAVKSFYKLANGHYIFDLGQNFAGWNRLKINATTGDTITLTMAEEIYPDGTLNVLTTGTVATKVEQREQYIAKGGALETWEPRFTYHGFRYVEVAGLKSPPSKDLLTGIVIYSAVPAAGSFSCSNNQINKLHELSYWTIISNLHSIPTDCPHREKCGWLGDAHAMGPATIYNLDMQNFWLKYLDDIHSTARVEVNTIFHVSLNKVFRKGYKEPGIPFMVAPGKRLPGAASADWGTAVVQLPWFLYKYYGNKNALEKFYPDMRQWVNYVGGLAVGNVVHEGLGDWCPPGDVDNIDCPIPLSSTAFHYHDLQLMKQVAGVLGNSTDSMEFDRRGKMVKQAFIDSFYNRSMHTYGSHTANSMALDFALIPDGEGTLVADAIVKTSKEKFKGFMYAGIFGLQRLFEQLSNNNNEQAAFDIINKKGDYSFELMWKKYDATTLWEVLPVDTMQQKTERTFRRSHNHPMQAGFDAWFFNGIAGIQPDIKMPGFKKIIFAPKLTGQLDWAKGSYESVYGPITSEWKMQGKTMTWEISIPVGSEGRNTDAGKLQKYDYQK